MPARYTPLSSSFWPTDLADNASRLGGLAGQRRAGRPLRARGLRHEIQHHESTFVLPRAAGACFRPDGTLPRYSRGTGFYGANPLIGVVLPTGSEGARASCPRWTTGTRRERAGRQHLPGAPPAECRSSSERRDGTRRRHLPLLQPRQDLVCPGQIRVHACQSHRRA